MSCDAKAAPILVVEDDPDVRSILQSLLERLGHTVYLADCGDSALDCLRVRQPSPCLILLDMTLPRMSGSELLRRLRGEAFTQPVIVASGQEEEEIRENLDGQAVEGILVKPYSLPDLIDAVQRYIPDGSRNSDSPPASA